MKKILSLTLVLLMGITVANAANRINYGKFRAGTFSDNYVMFAKGNMNYFGQSDVFEIYSTAYESHGNNSQYISSTTNYTWDLFGWGTSGATFNTKTYPAWLVSTDRADYAGTMIEYTNANSNANYKNYDWATYNNVNHESAGVYQTPTYENWNWILFKRDNAANLKGAAKINTVNGYIILPDNWSTPLDLKFVPGATNPSTNYYTLAEWAIMEAAGAIFLPTFGYREGTEWQDDGIGHYWTSTSHRWNSEAGTNKTAYEVVLGGANPTSEDAVLVAAPFSKGNAVRLIENKKHSLETVRGEETKTIDDKSITSYEWHGRTLTKSGDYTFTFLEVREDVDSIATLHLRMAVDAAIEAVPTTSKVNAQKVIRDGQLFIIRDDKVYNAAGQEVK